MKKRLARVVIAVALFTTMFGGLSVVTTTPAHAASYVYYPTSFPYLPDGDVIRTKNGSSALTNTVEFCLQLRKNVSWWKGIIFFPNRGGRMTIVDVEDTHTQYCGQLPADELAHGRLYLSKAGFLGIHDNTYLIANTSSAFRNGRVYFFFWDQD